MVNYYQYCAEMTVSYGLSDDCGRMKEMNDPCLLSCYVGIQVIVLPSKIYSMGDSIDKTSE